MLYFFAWFISSRPSQLPLGLRGWVSLTMLIIHTSLSATSTLSHNKQEERIPLTLTFHPHNISVKNTIEKTLRYFSTILPRPRFFCNHSSFHTNRIKTQAISKSTVHSNPIINPAHSNFHVLVLSSPTQTNFPDQSELLPSPIISCAFLSISSTVLTVPHAKNIRL